MALQVRFATSSGMHERIINPELYIVYITGTIALIFFSNLAVAIIRCHAWQISHPVYTML